MWHLEALPFPVQISPGLKLQSRVAGVPLGSRQAYPSSSQGTGVPRSKLQKQDFRGKRLDLSLASWWAHVLGSGFLSLFCWAWILVASLPARKQMEVCFFKLSARKQVVSSWHASRQRQNLTLLPQKCSPWWGAVGCKSAPASPSPLVRARSFLIDIPAQRLAKQTCEISLCALVWHRPFEEQGRCEGRWMTWNPPAYEVFVADKFWV